MTTNEVKKALAEIRQQGLVENDCERAHGLEDDMRREVLRAIAGGAPNPSELAKLALTSDEWAFARCCA